MSGAGALGGWALAALLGLVLLRLRRRLERALCAEHELRGPATVLALVAERLERDAGARRHAPALRAQLERLAAGLGDLAAISGARRRAGTGAPLDLEALARGTLEGWAVALERRGRPVRLRWDAGTSPPARDRGRAAQAIGNLVANAVEHGRGPVELRAARAPGGVRLEVVSRPAPPRARPGARRSKRGRGLSIARHAAAELGGELDFRAERGRFVAALELPDDPPAAA